MTRDFLVGARPMHDGDMLKLGMRQLAVSESILIRLLSDYEKTKSPELAQEIAEECTFISQTLDALDEMAYSQTTGQTFVISGALLKARKYLRDLIERAERVVVRQEEK